MRNKCTVDPLVRCFRFPPLSPCCCPDLAAFRGQLRLGTRLPRDHGASRAREIKRIDFDLGVLAWDVRSRRPCLKPWPRLRDLHRPARRQPIAGQASPHRPRYVPLIVTPYPRRDNRNRPVLLDLFSEAPAEGSARGGRGATQLPNLDRWRRQTP